MYEYIGHEREIKELRMQVDGLILLFLFLGGYLLMATKINAPGHASSTNNPETPISVTVAAAVTIAAGTYRCFYNVAGVATLFDGLEASANAFWGLIGPGTYAMGGAASLFPIGSVLPPEMTPINGEAYASGTDGTLKATLALAVPLTQWSLQVAQCTSEGVRVMKGLVEQREV